MKLLVSATVELVKKLRMSVTVVQSFPEIPGEASVEELKKRMSSIVARGTAYAVTSDKFVTCHHVVENLLSKHMKLTGAPDYTAGLPINVYNVVEVKSDPQLDIALLTTERVQGQILPISLDSGTPQVGLDILAVGYPLPEQRAPELIEKEKRINVNVVTTFRALRGIIASRTTDGLRFEIDKMANPGQSGGPIVSIETGRVVGMCQAYRWVPTQQGVMPADLSLCLSADPVRRKLSDWGIQV